VPEFQQKVESEAAKVEALKAHKNADAKINEYCDAVVGTAKSGSKQLTELEGKLESREAKAYLTQNTPNVVNKLKQIAEKGRSVLDKKKGIEEYIVYPDIETLHSELKKELGSLKDEMGNFEKMEAARADMLVQLTEEQQVTNNENASLDERLNASNSVATALATIAGRLPKEAASPGGKALMDSVSKALNDNMERISYERQNLNIAKRISAGSGYKIKLPQVATDIDLTKINEPLPAPKAPTEPVPIIEGTAGRDYSPYFKVDNRGGITMTPAMEELSKSNPEEYKKIIGELYKESGGIDLDARTEELEKVSANVAFFKGCVDEYEKNPTIQNRELVLRNALPGGKLPPMNGRASTGNPALDAIYSGQDAYTQEYNDAARVYGEASERFEKLDRESNDKLAGDVLGEIESNWQASVAPQIAAYNFFEGKGFKEIMQTIGQNPALVDTKKLNSLIEEHSAIGDATLKVLLTVQKITAPLKGKPLEAKLQQRLDKIVADVRDRIDRIESNKLRIRTVSSLQGIPEFSGSDILKFVMILDKPNEQGKRYVIFEEELKKVPAEQREIIRSRIDRLVEMDLQAVKSESGKITEDMDKMSPEAEAKMREQFGKNGEKYFLAMDKMKSGDLRLAASLCREFIALANGLKEEEKNKVRNLVANANETLKLISVRQVAVLEELYGDLSLLQNEQFGITGEAERHSGTDPRNMEISKYD